MIIALYDLKDTDSQAFKSSVFAKAYSEKVLSAYDLFMFEVEIQQSLAYPEYKKIFFNKLNLTEEKFKLILKRFLDIDEKKVRSISKVIPPSEKAKKIIKDTEYVFRIEKNSQLNFLKAVNNVLRSLDYKSSKGKTQEDIDLREYTYGDDTRRINWKVWARSDKHYVNLNPVKVNEINSPLHVVLDYSSLVNADLDVLRLPSIEIIRALQIDSKKTGREIFITLRENKNYFKLPLNIPPSKVLEILMSYEKKEEHLNPLVISNKEAMLPKNILYVSYTIKKAKAFEYLYGNRCNLATINLRDKRFLIHMQVNDKFVEHGMSED